MHINKVAKELRLVEHAKGELTNILDAIPALIALIDKNHTIVRLNKAMADVFGVHPRQLVGKKCFELCHKEKKIPPSCPHKKVLEKGMASTSEIYEENLGGYVEVTATPYRDPDGSIIGSVHVVKNINERKRAKEEKEEIMRQLLNAQKLEEVGRLAAGIAHEINTPSQYVASNLEFLKESFKDISELVDRCSALLKGLERGQVDQNLVGETTHVLEDVDWDYLKEELPEAIDQAQEGIQRVSKIVRAMKEFSHPGPKEKILQDLNKIIETTVTVSKNEWKYVADVQLDLDQGLPPTYCLGDEIGQVILNMIVNAAHAISESLGENPEQKKGLIKISSSTFGVNFSENVRDNILK